jgi:staphylococcal nuclease domain-containing protein 1
MHPNGNIAEFLTSAGLAKVIDVSSVFPVCGGGPDQ